MAYIATFFEADAAASTVGPVICGASLDGETWLNMPNWDFGLAGLRDPSLIRIGSTYYLTGTAAGTNSFPIYSASGIGQPFSLVQNVSTSALVGVTNTWAAEWFVDPADGSVHILVSLSTGGYSGNFGVYELHPTSGNNVSGTWTSPVLLWGGSFVAGGQFIDGFCVVKSGTYYLWVKKVGGANLIEIASASSLTGTYSAYKTGDWAGWGAGWEGPSLIQVGSRWYLYADRNPTDGLYSGQMAYSYSDDDWATWSAWAFVTQLPASWRTAKHGSVLSLPNELWQISSLTPAAVGAPALTLAADNSGPVKRSGRLGQARLGAFQLGSTPEPGDQTIVPGALGPARAIPSPTIAGAPITITLTGKIGPRRAWQNPTVAGPISGATIGPRRAWPTPLMNVQQVLYLYQASPFVDYTITGARSIPAPTVGFVTSIYVGTAFSGARSIPSPTVRGGDQYVNVVGGIPARRAWPVPTVSGGEQDTRIFLGGVDVTEYLSWEAGLTVQSQTIGRWRASFAFESSEGINGFMPELGQQVMIVDRGYRVFAGCLTDRVVNRLMMTTSQLKISCTAADKSSICDHRVVTGKTYLAGEDVATVILDIHSNFLNGEGLIPSAAIAAGAFGTLPADLYFNFPTVTNAFDQIANLAGLVWWVDPFLTLHFSAFTSLPAAPFSWTETSNNWRNLLVKETTTDYYNKLYAVSNRNILPGGGSGGTGTAGAGNAESFTWTPDGPGIQTITDGTGTRVAVGIIASTPIGSIQSLTVNGVAQTTVDYGAYAGQTASPPDLLWLWGGPATGSPGAIVQPQVLPSAGAAIVIQYLPAVSTSSSVAQYGTALVPTGDPLGTCGSGIYEGVLQVQNTSSQEDLNAIAAAALARIGGIPKIVTGETDYSGLQPGQKFTVNVPLSGANNLSLLITNVVGRFVPPDLGAGRGAFTWTIEARSNLDPGNWAKWYERVIARTNNPLPVLQYEEATFVVPASSTLSSGVNIANPYIVGRTGRVVELLVAASTPPTGQDLILLVQANGGALVGQITLPAGTLANTLVAYELPADVQRYVFARDVLNVSASYSVTGTGTPTRAAGVTLKARWAI